METKWKLFRFAIMNAVSEVGNLVGIPVMTCHSSSPPPPLLGPIRRPPVVWIVPLWSPMRALGASQKTPLPTSNHALKKKSGSRHGLLAGLMSVWADTNQTASPVQFYRVELGS